MAVAMVVPMNSNSILVPITPVVRPIDGIGIIYPPSNNPLNNSIKDLSLLHSPEPSPTSIFTPTPPSSIQSEGTYISTSLYNLNSPGLISFVQNGLLSPTKLVPSTREITQYTPRYASGYTPRYASGYTPRHTPRHTPGYTPRYTPRYTPSRASLDSIYHSGKRCNETFTISLNNIDPIIINNIPQFAPKINKVRKKQIRNVTIVNPLFFDCANYTDDPVWKVMLFNISRGRFPRMFNCRNGILSFRKKNSLVEIIIPEDPIQATTTCITFIQQNGGYYSPIDKKERRLIMESKLLGRKPFSEYTWPEIKNKKTRTNLKTKFVRQVAEILNLTHKERQNLYHIINEGFLLGHFTNDSVEMEDGEIINITGLSIDQKRKTFHINTKVTGNPKLPKVKNIMADRTYFDSQNKVNSVPNKKVDYLEMWNKRIPDFYIKRKSHMKRLPTQISIEESSEGDQGFKRSVSPPTLRDSLPPLFQGSTFPSDQLISTLKYQDQDNNPILIPIDTSNNIIEQQKILHHR